MSGPAVGFFGKLPSHGDFIERRVTESFREVWDPWLQRGITDSRAELGGRWLDCYLTSPLWRFFLSEGVAGAASYAGLLLPSVDRVGRYFPLTVVVELPAGLAPLAFARAAAGWFSEVESLCTGAVQDAQLQLEHFDADLSASGEKLAGLDRAQGAGGFAGPGTQWHWPLSSVDRLSSALADPLMSAPLASLRPLTLWWTAGSELVHPSVLLVRALPRSESFAALLAGTWDDGRWDGVAVGEAPGLVCEEPGAAENLGSAAAEFTLTSGGATHVGTVRSENQDGLLLNDANRLWAVADGLGGYRDGGRASQMVIDALNALVPTSSLNATLQSASEALTRVNADLRRGALGVSDAVGGGSTVVTLVIRGDEWAAQWAGDSRAYRYREGVLLQLTHDHSAAEELDPDATAPRLIATRGDLTRAVGGNEELLLDCVSERLTDGDRFLLCSDGLYDALDEASLQRCLEEGDPARASRALIEAACAAGARDNVTAVVVDARTLQI
jgi:type VI secretion system protein ImpM